MKAELSGTQVVNLTDIVIDLEKFHHLRIDKDEDVEELSLSIKEVGLISPLTISPKFELLAGARRYQALKKAGYKTAPCYIVPESDPLKLKIISIDENIVRSNFVGARLDFALFERKKFYLELHPQTAQAVAGGVAKAEKVKKGKIVEVKGETPANVNLTFAPKSFTEDAAEKLNVSKSTIERSTARVEGLHEVLFALYLEEKMSKGIVDVLVLFPKEKQPALWDEAKDLPGGKKRQFLLDQYQLFKGLSPTPKEVQVELPGLGKVSESKLFEIIFTHFDKVPYYLSLAKANKDCDSAKSLPEALEKLKKDVNSFTL